jgi:hypothetical protein
MSYGTVKLSTTTTDESAPAVVSHRISHLITPMPLVWITDYPFMGELRIHIPFTDGSSLMNFLRDSKSYADGATQARDEQSHAD